MINTQIRIHDKYSVEFKIGFHLSEKLKDFNNFKINTWIFVPNGLDVNKYTYNKERFYADIKTNVRLITPIYSLEDLLNESRGPFPRLNKAIEELVNNPSDTSMENYLYHIKMLLCILKSAYRDGSYKILRAKEKEEQEAALLLIGQMKEINRRYRIIRDRIRNNETLSEEQKEYILFGDEFLSFTTEENCYLILSRLNKKDASSDEIKQAFMALIRQEGENKRAMGYTIPDENDNEHNSLMLIKKSVLKKFVESDLYLQRIKKADGAAAREFYYGIAAGLAMIFATVVSFVATQQLGNFTTSLFLVLVISYIFKDRIKETFRTYFASKLDKKYFDWKWDVSINQGKIGYIKEAFDFISQGKVPEEIMNLRKKTPLVEAENQVYDEKVILYRKRVFISKKELEEDKQYHFPGINDIIRFNLDSFTKKMDNPDIPIYLPDEEHGYRIITGNRAYALYFILESRTEQDVYYKSYRVLFNRNGISDVKEI